MTTQNQSSARELPSLPEVSLRSVRLIEIQLPLVEPFRISSGVTTTRRIFLLQLEELDGHVSWSECVAGDLPNYSPETIDTAWLALREWIAPLILGRPLQADNLIQRLDHEIRGHEMAKAAIEMGVWGMAALKAGVGLSTAIGGNRSHVATGISLGIQETPEALVEKAAAALAAGYAKIKIKIKPGADLDYLRPVREELGPSAPLMADANNAYSLDSEGPDGIAPLLAIDELDLVMIEQPLAWDDVVRHAELQRQLQTPVCLDESITNLAKAQTMIQMKSGRIINIKPGRVGGFAVSRAIHDLCRAHDVPVWCGGMLESGIGRAYNVALASLAGFTIPGDISPSARYWARDIVSPEWTMNDEGLVAVPQSPGLGVEIDRDQIDDLTVREELVA